MRYWLLKSEPGTFSIDHLARAPRKTTSWDGVRNFQARNFLRDSLAKGDLAFFYHSSCEVPGIAGIVTVVRAGYPDRTAYDADDPHFDPGSDPRNPVWYAVDVRLVTRLAIMITLERLRMHATRELKDLAILKRGNRLSVTPVTKSEWDCILSLQTAPGRVRTSSRLSKK